MAELSLGTPQEIRRKAERTEVLKVLNEYLSLGQKLVNPPRVELRRLSMSPEGEVVGAESDAISTAIQCYAPGVAKMGERTTEREIGIGETTLEAGHHTTRMHTHYTWHLVNVTRSITHDVFHATPFYNSEQQSQRYVEAKSGNHLLPAGLTPSQTEFFRGASDYSNAKYFELLSDLGPVVDQRVRDMNPVGGWKVDSTRERLEGKVQKLCQEIARYVLPIGQHTIYFHTLSELQLLRLFRASNMPGFTDEARYIIAKMIGGVAAKDQSILDELEVPVSVEGIEASDRFNPVDLDRFLGEKRSRLVTGSIPSEFGDRLMYNLKILADVYEIGMFDPRTSSMREIPLTFVTKISHTGNSQRQRHRRTPSKVMNIEEIYDGSRDWIAPLVVEETPQLKRFFDETIDKMFENVETALEMGIPREYALLLLPNATTIRLKESGDLFDWVHRWKQRLCYLAQEEIFFASLDQVEDVLRRVPDASAFLLAPCGIRQAAGVSPRCPEGKKWCGQPVFNWQIDKYREHRLI